MKNIILNPTDEVSAKKFMSHGSLAYEFISLENPQLMCYVYDGYIFDHTGTYMRDSNWERVESDLAIGEDVTEYYKETYDPYLEDGAHAFNATATVDGTPETGYFIQGVYEFDKRFVYDYNGSYFNESREVYIVTEDNARYSGTYICDGRSIEIVDVQEYQDMLVDTDSRWWKFYDIQFHTTNCTDAFDAFYYALGCKWEKVGGREYVSDYSMCSGKTFIDGEYYTYWYMNSQSPRYNPCTYTGTTDEPITVISSAGTQIQATGKTYKIDFGGGYVCALASGSNYSNVVVYTGATWETLRYLGRGDLRCYQFSMGKVPATSGGNTIQEPIPGIAYTRDNRRVYYNKGGIPIQRINDGQILYLIKSRTFTFSDAFNEWFTSNCPFGYLGDTYVSIDPSCIESIIINGTEYKSLVDSGEWDIELVYGQGLHNIVTHEYIYPNDQNITVRFTEEFFRNGKLFVLYSTHAA